MLRAALLVALAAVGLGAAEWHHDLDAARTLAQERQRDLLVLFTGSDWCSWCKKLDREILSKPAFRAAVAERFVLVELDFPRKTPLPEAQAAANAAAKERYAVRGFPTVALLRPDGSRYAATGYRRLEPEAYVEHLDQLIAARDRGPELEAAVAAAEGPAEARARHALIEHRDLVRDEVAIAELEALLAADPDDETGLSRRYGSRLARERRAAALDAAREDPQRQRELIAEGLADPLQDAEYRQGMHYRLAFIALSAKDTPAAIAAMDAAIAAAPDSDRVGDIRRLRDALQANLDKQR